MRWNACVCEDSMNDFAERGHLDVNCLLAKVFVSITVLSRDG
jgi:hypothetical protein